MTYEQLLLALDTFANHADRSSATIAKNAGAYARLPARLRKGEGCSVRTMNETIQWLSMNWPEDLEWPSDIPRPLAQKGAA